MKLSLGFSSCPNDTFMFDALVHGKINTGSFNFIYEIADIEKLNNRAFFQELDVTKLSFFAYSKVNSYYNLLTSGCALGRGNGPLLISKKKIFSDEIPYLKVAVPGINTTANLLLSIAYPLIKEKKVYLFSDIEEVVLSGEADVGLIIHETRFSYQKKGLKKVLDLGEYWEKTTSLPLPLGAIVIKKSIDTKLQHEFNSILRRSIEYGVKNPDSAIDFIKRYAQELDEITIRKHVNLYVNQFSVYLGEEGKNAINKLFEISTEKGIIGKMENHIFVE